MCIATFNELCPEMHANGPFVNVEANAVALAACLSYPCPPTPVWGGFNCGCNCGCGCGCTSPSNIVNNCECTSPSTLNATPIAVNVTIGLFAVVKLFRLSNIRVENHGFCMPEDCSETSPISTNPCEFFDELDFPVNLFAPQSDYTPSSYEGTTDWIPGNSACCGETPSCSPNTGNASTGGCNCGCRR